MSFSKGKQYDWFRMNPWVLLGAVLILVPIFVFWTWANIHRQNESTIHLLKEKGAALIRSFEAGARTGMMGMMGMHGADFQLQRLLTETAQLPDVVHFIVLDTKGVILAHSDPSQIGRTYGTGLDLERISRSETVQWREVSGPESRQVFEVYRRFAPIRGRFSRPHRMMGRMMRPPASGENLGPQTPKSIFVGLDMEPVESARKDDTRHIMIMGFILLLIGFAGIVSLFLAQAYRETKSSLSRVRAFSDHLVANMPIGLVAVNTQGTVVSFNQTAETLLRKSGDDVVGRSPRDVLPQPLLRLIHQLEGDRKLVEEELECPAGDGQLVPLEVIATSLHEGTAGFLGTVLLFRDLTQIQELKEEVERSRRLASIGRLAAGVAHELRNPLSSIKGFATYFKERYRDVPEDQRTAEIMIQEVERLNRAIGQLLEFARPMNIQRKPTALEDLVRQSLELIQGDAERNKIQIELSDIPKMRDVSVDPDRFKQVLLNLYLNAIEAMEEGGTLSVSVVRKNDQISLTVSDTGKGISSNDLSQIFDPYFTTKSSGTGLGLAIVHRIVESHGGQIRVESRPGQGTSVTITIPASRELHHS